jgi:hypothetical protein
LPKVDRSARARPRSPQHYPQAIYERPLYQP